MPLTEAQLRLAISLDQHVDNTLASSGGGEALWVSVYDDMGSTWDVASCKPCCKPWSPAWRRHLKLPEAAFQGTYLFKVSWGRVWRRIAIAGQDDGGRLGRVMLDAFELTHDHLYPFSYRHRFGVLLSIHHPLLEERPLTREVRVGDLPFRPGAAMTSGYNFGDRWEFDIQLARHDPVHRTLDQARILEAYGYGRDRDRREVAC